MSRDVLIDDAFRTVAALAPKRPSCLPGEMPEPDPIEAAMEIVRREREGGETPRKLFHDRA